MAATFATSVGVASNLKIYYISMGRGGDGEKCEVKNMQSCLMLLRGSQSRTWSLQKTLFTLAFQPRGEIHQE